MRAVIDTSYFIEFINSPFETKFQWVLDNKLITTSLFAYEFHNVLLKALKIPTKDLHKFHNTLCNLTMETRSIDGNEVEIYKLASEHRLSFYDASYLWLSINMKLPIATYDKALLHVANNLKIDVIK
jgi:predicted nucleic acid-binding protein